MIIKDLSKFTDINITMNLHEECLLKYLTNPLDLFHYTELLKLTNSLIETGSYNTENLSKSFSINYTGV